MNFNNTSSRNFSLGLRGGVGGAGGSLGNGNTASSAGGGGLHLNNSIKYVYELPYLERKEICRIFDENNLWETLGKKIGNAHEMNEETVQNGLIVFTQMYNL